MKALIISDDILPVSQISAALHAHGYETIHYKWLTKALDNVEEIEPDLSVINVRDYPRHWKIFAQFSKINGKAGGIILYAPEPLSDSEQAKAEAVGIKGCFSLDGGADELNRLLDGVQNRIAGTACESECDDSSEEILIPSVDSILKEGSSLPCLQDAEDGCDSAALKDGGRPAPYSGEDAVIPSVDVLFDKPCGEDEAEPLSEPRAPQEPETAPSDSDDAAEIPSVDAVAFDDAPIPSVDAFASGGGQITSAGGFSNGIAEPAQNKVKPGKSLLLKIEQLYEKK